MEAIAKDYQVSITAPITPAEALDKISRVNEWWAKNFEGSAKKLHDIFVVRFGETFVQFKITDMIADKKIVWAVQDCYLHWLSNKTEWNHTSVIWEIDGKKNITEIGMTHIVLKPGVECFNDCEKGWYQHVKGSLYRLLTEGRGNPE